MKTKEEIKEERREKGFCFCLECIEIDYKVECTLEELRQEMKPK